jgi:MFS family permease
VLAGTLAGTFNIWFVFLPAHLVAERRHGLSVALTCAVTGLIAVGAAAPLLGRLSDRIGRRPVLLGATPGLCLLAVPAYALATGGSLPACVADIAIGDAGRFGPHRICCGMVSRARSSQWGRHDARAGNCAVRRHGSLGW